MGVSVGVVGLLGFPVEVALVRCECSKAATLVDVAKGNRVW